MVEYQFKLRCTPAELYGRKTAVTPVASTKSLIIASHYKHQGKEEEAVILSGMIPLEVHL